MTPGAMVREAILSASDCGGIARGAETTRLTDAFLRPRTLAPRGARREAALLLRTLYVAVRVEAPAKFLLTAAGLATRLT